MVLAKGSLNGKISAMAYNRSLEYAAKEILALRDDISLVQVEQNQDGYLTARTLGSQVTFRADTADLSGAKLDEYFSLMRHVAALLQPDEKSPIPDIPSGVPAHQVYLVSRLRPHSLPIFNGHCTIVWHESDGYRH